MKQLLFIILFVITAQLNVPDNTAAQGHFPEQLNELENAQPDRYFNRVKDIPQSVQDAFGSAMRAKEFKMADHGGAWNKTDVVTDASLPFRRLVWAVEIKGYYVIHYEMGGVGYSTHYLVAGIDETSKSWKVFWTATSFKIARDYAEFIEELRNGQLDADPKFIH